MNLAEALDVLAAPDMDVAKSNEPLRVIGAHLARLAGARQAGTVPLAVDPAGLALAAGAADHFGSARPSVVAVTARPYMRPVDLRWMTSRPPAGRPLAVFVYRITSGQTLRAVLEDLDRPRSAPPVTVLAVAALPEGVEAVRGDHPIAAVVTPKGSP